MSLSDIKALGAFKDNYIWCIVDKEHKTFDCVDPGDAVPVLDYIKSEGMTLKNILLTHHHYDHVGGVEALIKAYPQISVYGPDDPRIPYITHSVKDKDCLKISNNTYRVLSNPGHTSTHISFYEPHEGWLFCGDTLFSAGCGRVFDGTLEQLHASLLMFKQLPPNTLVFCAHEYTRQNCAFALTVEPHNKILQDYANQLTGCTLPSTIDLECQINPFLRTQSPDVIQFALNHGALNQESLEVFRVLRLEKNHF